jgi:hypothetical protein
MEPENKQPKITQLLEKLQEESWQLELLISGFAIFLVGASFEFIQDLMIRVKVLGLGYDQQGLLEGPVLILLATWLFLLTNLIMHVVLRGFWIAAIGLRYVSGDVDFEVLNFAPKFDKYLRRRIPSFDLFIERLEKICSVVFAFTFLIIFMFISVGMFVALMALLESVLEPLLGKFLSDGHANIIKSVIGLIVFFGGFIYFVDFLTLGWVKRRKWFSRIYYPVYRFYSLITLSFLYRPLYYNLIDDKFGRRVGLLIFPYIILLFTIMSMKVEAFKYFPNSTSQDELSHEHYLDMMKEEEYIKDVNIPSKYVSSDFLELYIPYKARYDDEIETICPGIKPDKKLGPRFSILRFSSDNHSSPTDSLLDCVSQLHQVYINDSLYQDVDFHFYKHPNHKEQGLLSVIDIIHLDRGQHHLKVLTAINATTSSTKKDTIVFRSNAKFPFWKE